MPFILDVSSSKSFVSYISSIRIKNGVVFGTAGSSDW